MYKTTVTVILALNLKLFNNCNFKFKAKITVVDFKMNFFLKIKIKIGILGTYYFHRYFANKFRLRIIFIKTITLTGNADKAMVPLL